LRVIGWIVTIGASAAMGICWSQNSTSGPSSPCPVDANATLQSVWAELRVLRAELLEDRRAMQQAKLEDLRKQLAVVEAQRCQIELEQNSRTEQLAEIETQLQQSNLEKNEREELESQKAQLLKMPLEPSPAVQNALSGRQTEVRSLLAEQEHRMSALDQLAHQLSGAQ
jgi:septal ring factor EnvC (AmiA/AmiB activator)